MVVTPLYAGLLVIWFLVLSAMVIRFRRAGRVSLGDGGNQSLLRAIRGHANFAEYVPLALLLMAILEMSRFSIYLLHALGITLVVARLLHGYALTFAAHFRFGRTAGAVLTFAVLIIEAVLCLYQAYRGHLGSGDPMAQAPLGRAGRGRGRSYNAKRLRPEGRARSRWVDGATGSHRED